MRTVLFGVDGLTFRVLHPLIERGDLPNFRKLSENGCEAILESKYPPVTPAAWTSISTGMKPAAHGVYDFWEYEELREKGTARIAHVQTKRKGGKAIWNILSEFGKQVLVINVPSTYPPDAVNGIMLSGYMTPSSDVDFTYPLAFKEELYRAVPNYQIDLEHADMFSMILSEKEEPLIDSTLRMTEQRIKLTMYLMKEKPWDFCYVVFVGADRLQHPLWDEIMALDPRVIKYYHLLDYGLGLILEQLGPDDTLFVVSDHGFQGARSFFDINEYLFSKGLLKLANYEQRNRASRFTDLKHTLDRLQLLSLVRKAKKALKKSGFITQEAVDMYRPVLSDVDWQQTTAYVPSVSGFGGGYADIFLTDDLDAARVAELCADLKNLVDPVTDQPLVDALYTTEVFGTGPYAPPEQHLLILPNDGVTFRMSFGNERLWDTASKTRGTHQKDGVLYAYGSGIKCSFKAPNAEIYDLVPTVLRSMNLPFPCEFDGRVLDELFEGRKQVEHISLATVDGAEVGLARRKLKRLLEA